ncbi:hypothetical protein GGX14DRAFT_410078 [Mycena pura]|uniref:Uncharacterized protein n=1 Tax=Mycena pura TaxID=153505 RepID=A0AAD6YUS9_9AGAR|nr:hypothetical protein GGX14DRAFT_410078 [Mycena pura]
MELGCLRPTPHPLRLLNVNNRANFPILCQLSLMPPRISNVDRLPRDMPPPGLSFGVCDPAFARGINFETPKVPPPSPASASPPPSPHAPDFDSLMYPWAGGNGFLPLMRDREGSDSDSDAGAEADDEREPNTSTDSDTDSESSDDTDLASDSGYPPFAELFPALHALFSYRGGSSDEAAREDSDSDSNAICTFAVTHTNASSRSDPEEDPHERWLQQRPLVPRRDHRSDDGDEHIFSAISAKYVRYSEGVSGRGTHQERREDRKILWVGSTCQWVGS